MPNNKNVLAKQNWIPLMNDLMFHYVFGDIRNEKLIINLIKCVFNFPNSKLKGAKITNGSSLQPDNIENKTFITDVLVELLDGDLVLVEAQNNLDENAMIKNELYHQRLMTNQVVHQNKYDKIHNVYQLVIINGNQVHKENTNILEKYYITGEKSGFRIIEKRFMKY